MCANVILSLLHVPATCPQYVLHTFLPLQHGPSRLATLMKNPSDPFQFRDIIDALKVLKIAGTGGEETGLRTYKTLRVM